MKTLGQFSFLVGALVIIIGLALIMLRAQQFPTWLRIGLPVAASLGALALWLSVRPTPTPDIKTMAHVDRLLQNGKPTVLEFYSEY
jgi:hypothetical protein